MTIEARAVANRGCAGAPPVHLPVRAQAPRTTPSLHIALLDGLRFYVDGREVVLHGRKARALLAYLVLTPGMKETRDRLVGLFWSETENAKARASLRQLLHVVRETLDAAGFAGFACDKTHVSLDGALIATDVGEALDSIGRGEPVDQLVYERRIADSFMRGYDEVDPSFGDWLCVKREHLHQLVIDRLEAQLAATAHGNETAKRIARALLQVDPTHEVACQTLMRACVALGNIGSALTAYKQLWECLEREYDVEPSAATKALVVAIKRGHNAPAATGFAARLEEARYAAVAA